jgi:DNA modification methylase
MSTVDLRHGNCIEVMRGLADCSVDAVVTDPPYGIGFMGKVWDAKFIGSTIEKRRQYPGDPSPNSGANGGYRSAAAEAGRYDQSISANRQFQDWCEVWARECLRVLRPGGHLLASGSTRTWHRLACAVEDAGFEMRDSIAWLYGSGFPKSLDVSKAIDKAAGAEREVTGPGRYAGRESVTDFGIINDDAWQAGAARTETAPATEAAQQWQGWGTALKPAFEPIVVARKPLVGTVAQNVMAHGTGALNINGCRIGTDSTIRPTTKLTSKGLPGGGYGNPDAVRPLIGTGGSESGRWPANVALDEDQAAALDQQSGTGISRKGKPRGAASGEGWGMTATGAEYDDQGGASRFFYVAKAPKKERPVVDGVAHPTVKPLALMRWLVRLVTPPGGTVLEPFAGSGATVEAAILEGFDCIAIEREADYLPLIQARIFRAQAAMAEQAEIREPDQLDLFGDDAA